MKKTIGISAALLVLFILILYLLIYHSDLYLFFLDRKRLAEFIKSPNAHKGVPSQSPLGWRFS